MPAATQTPPERLIQVGRHITSSRSSRFISVIERITAKEPAEHFLIDLNKYWSCLPLLDWQVLEQAFFQET